MDQDRSYTPFVQHVKDLVRRSRHYKPEIRQPAIAELQSQYILEGVMELAQDRLKENRAQALDLLEEIGTPPAIAAICKMVKSDRSSTLRRKAIAALETKEAGLQVIIGAMLTDSSSYVRRTAAIALRRFHLLKHLLSQHLMEALATDDNSYVRYEAAKTLGIVRAYDAVYVLAEALINDDNSYVQYAAAQALHKLGDTSVVPTLLVGMMSDNFHVRRASAEALMAMNTDIMALLRQNVFHENAKTRWLHFNALYVISEPLPPPTHGWHRAKGAMN